MRGMTERDMRDTQALSDPQQYPFNPSKKEAHSAGTR